MRSSATITTKWQVTLPAALRQRLRLEPGDKLMFLEQGDGSVILKRKPVVSLDDLKGIVPYDGPPLSDDDLVAMVDAARSAQAEDT